MLLPNFLPVTWRCGDVATPNPLQLSGSDSSQDTEEFNSPLRVNTVTDWSSESRRVGNSTRSPWRLWVRVCVRGTFISRSPPHRVYFFFLRTKRRNGGLFLFYGNIYICCGWCGAEATRSPYCIGFDVCQGTFVSFDHSVSCFSILCHRRHFTRATPSGKPWQRSPYCKVHDCHWKYIIVSTL